jgi:cytochrome d ubiquinol oxidase subunit II
MNQVLDFVPIWTAILGMAVFLLRALDGFDLGVGCSTASHPTHALATPSWIRLRRSGTGTKLGLVMEDWGFSPPFRSPIAIIIPAVYFPILVMLLALVFRGVAFEFVFAISEHKQFGITRSRQALRSPPSRKASCSGPSFMV